VQEQEVAEYAHRLNLILPSQILESQFRKTTPGGWNALMSEYRAYYVGTDGNFEGSRALDCDSDTTAIASARKLLDGKDVEIWCGLRKIIRLPHKPE
jgi:hypothetical protein